LKQQKGTKEITKSSIVATNDVGSSGGGDCGAGRNDEFCGS
jgi:hypothetical protein